MYSPESEESDNDTETIHFKEFLYARHHKYEWKDLELNALEKNLAWVFDDILLDMNKNLNLILTKLLIFVVII